MAARTRTKPPKLETLDLDLHPNEASDLLPFEHEPVLRARGWDVAFWSVLDEGPIENCMAVIGHKRGAGHDRDAWEILRPRFRVDANADSTEDAEACARRDGWVYVVGSQYGSKSGPLEKKRAFLARFREDRLGKDPARGTPEMEVVLNRFRLHRAVNDAFRAFGPRLLDPGPSVRKRLIARTRKKAGKKASRQIEKTDVPVNVEGAAFTDSGALMLGLRFPVTADGHPIIAEVSGVEQMFDDGRASPVVRRFWVIDNVGTKRTPCGIRAMHRRGAELHVIAGNLESQDDDAVVLADHPEAARATCSHHRLKLPRGVDGGAVEAELVHDFNLPNVEGLAADRRKRFYYVTDEDDRVHVRYLREQEPQQKRASASRGRKGSSGAQKGSRGAQKRSTGGRKGSSGARKRSTGGRKGG